MLAFHDDNVMFLDLKQFVSEELGISENKISLLKH